MQNKIIYNGKKYSGTYPTDLANNAVGFESADDIHPTAIEPMPLLTTKSRVKTLMHNISTAYKNVRWLLNLIGTTDISAIGDGTVTGALTQLNGKNTQRYPIISFRLESEATTEVELPVAGIYLASILNSYNVGGVHIIQTGTSSSTCRISTLLSVGDYFIFKSIGINKFSISSGGASGWLYVERLSVG